MNSERSLTEPKDRGRGRPPKGNAPMSSTERKRQSRHRLAANGSVEISLRLPRASVNVVDLMAAAAGESRTEVMNELLIIAIARHELLMDAAAKMYDKGVPREELERFLIQHMTPPVLTPDAQAPIEKEV